MNKMTETIVSREARTLNFGDFRGDNFFVSTTERKMAFIDFQVFNTGSPGYDFNQPTGTIESEVFSKHSEWVDDCKSASRALHATTLRMELQIYSLDFDLILLAER